VKIGIVQGGRSVSAKFSRRRGRPLPIIFAQTDMPYNYVADRFHTEKLCSRLSSSKVRFWMENGRFEFLSPLLGGLEATYDVHLRLVGKRVVDFLLVLTELVFARCYR